MNNYLKIPFLVTLSLTFMSGWTHAFGQNAPVEGFYVSTGGGMVVLDSTVSFPATPTRQAGKFVDQGGDGVIFGARAGWGQLVTQHTYLGGEIEGHLPWNVTSRLKAYGAEYRARLRAEVGVFGRAGWSPDGRSLIFARVGFVVPIQRFESVADGNRARPEWTPVPTIGAGAEIAITSRWAVRLDMSYSWPSGVNVIELYRMTAWLSYRF
jgi:opacity protein-like surface antigen